MQSGIMHSNFTGPHIPHVNEARAVCASPDTFAGLVTSELLLSTLSFFLSSMAANLTHMYNRRGKERKLAGLGKLAFSLSTSRLVPHCMRCPMRRWDPARPTAFFTSPTPGRRKTKSLAQYTSPSTTSPPPSAVSAAASAEPLPLTPC